MKKLMMAAAIVCAAAGVQAASCDWTAAGDGFVWSYNEAKGVDTYDAGSVGKYWIVALAANDTSGISVSNTGVLSLGADDKVATDGTGTFNLPGEVGAAGGITGLSLSDNGKYFAMVVYDTVNNLYGISATVEMAGIAEEPTPTPGNTMYFSNHIGSDFGKEDTDPWMVADIVGKPVSTPEPTSGLLLLIGMAGLALRRRRA